MFRVLLLFLFLLLYFFGNLAFTITMHHGLVLVYTLSFVQVCMFKIINPHKKITECLAEEDEDERYGYSLFQYYQLCKCKRPQPNNGCQYILF